jgi:hypothetical protein
MENILNLGSIFICFSHHNFNFNFIHIVSLYSLYCALYLGIFSTVWPKEFKEGGTIEKSMLEVIAGISRIYYSCFIFDSCYFFCFAISLHYNPSVLWTCSVYVVSFLCTQSLDNLHGALYLHTFLQYAVRLYYLYFLFYVYSTSTIFSVFILYFTFTWSRQHTLPLYYLFLVTIYNNNIICYAMLSYTIPCFIVFAILSPR